MSTVSLSILSPLYEFETTVIQWLNTTFEEKNDVSCVGLFSPTKQYLLSFLTKVFEGYQFQDCLYLMKVLNIYHSYLDNGK